jgi:NDP-sugar pyrophosphorylase family protein
LLAAQQTMDGGTDWYQGTADAVRQNLRYLQQPGIRYVLILSGDQLYRMDYRKMIESHERANADVSIATLPVHAAKMPAGWGSCEPTSRTRDRVPRKAEDRAELETVAPRLSGWNSRESRATDATAWPTWASICSTAIFWSTFSRQTDAEDFGRQVFPQAIDHHKVQIHLFDDYWEDIGTIKAFFDANLGIVEEKPSFRFGRAQRSGLLQAPLLAAHSYRWCDGSPQLDRRWLQDRQGMCDREQHHRLALYSRIERHHPQFDPDGSGLLRGGFRVGDGPQRRNTRLSG